MVSFSTKGLVLRHSDYGEYDRMVTLFTPERGRIDAVARGCRRFRSPLQNAGEPFTSGEFLITRRGERFSIEQCRISEGYYELREDYDRLRHGVYWLKLLEYTVMQDMPLEQLFLTTLRALAHLVYSDIPNELLTMAFEMHLMAQLGFAPRMDVCRACGRPLDREAHFDMLGGNCVCTDCFSTLPLISNGARRIMMKLPRTRYDQVRLLVDHPDWQEAARVFRGYIDDRLGTGRYAPPLPGGDRE